MSAYINVLWLLFVQYIPVALIAFAIVWLRIGKNVRIGRWRFIAGMLLTAVISALLRFASIFVVGGQLALSSATLDTTASQVYMVLFILLVPVATAILVGRRFKRLAGE